MEKQEGVLSYRERGECTPNSRSKGVGPVPIVCGKREGRLKKKKGRGDVSRHLTPLGYTHKPPA